MFIITDIKGSDVSVLDTTDGVIEVFPKSEVLELSKKVDIYGVPKNKDDLWQFLGIKGVIHKLITNDRIEEAVISCPAGYEIEIVFKSKPTGGEINFVHTYVYEWGKSANDEWYKMENKRSKSYSSGYSNEEVVDDIRRNCNWYKIDMINVSK